MDSIDLKDITPLQRKALNAYLSGEYYHIGMCAPVRQGKSAALAIILSHMCESFRKRGIGNDRYLALGTTATRVRENIEGYMEDCARQMGVKHFKSVGGVSSPRIEFGSAKISCYGAADADSHKAFQGMTATSVIMEEVTLFHPEAYRVGIQRRSYKQSLVVTTCNANSPFHWYKKKVLDSGSPGVKLIEGDIFDNQHFPEERRQELLNEDKGSALYKRNVLNMWVPDSGMVFPVGPEHTVDSGPEPKDVWGTAAIAVGMAGSTAGLLAVPDGDGVVILDEYYRVGHENPLTVTSEPEPEATHVARLAEGWNFDACVVDGSATVMRNAVLGASHLPRTAKHPITLDMLRLTNNAIRKGKIRIHERCENLLMETSSYRWNEVTGKPVRRQMYLCDALTILACNLFPAYREMIDAR